MNLCTKDQLVDSSESHVCVWMPDTDGKGDGEQEIGKLSEVQCAHQCKIEAVSNPKINGATRRKSDGSCWCEIGMKSQASSWVYNSCFLRGNNTQW